MDWRVMLVILGFIAIGYIILLILLYQRNKKIKQQKVKIEEWKGKYRSMQESLNRHIDDRLNGKLSDEQAMEKFNNLLSGWNAINADGDS